MFCIRGFAERFYSVFDTNLIMSYCIAFNENFFILSLVQTRSFLRGGSLNMQYTLDQLLNKISALEDPFQYFHFNRDVIGPVCVRLVQGISHRSKVFPQSLPNK